MSDTLNVPIACASIPVVLEGATLLKSHTLPENNLQMETETLTRDSISELTKAVNQFYADLKANNPHKQIFVYEPIASYSDEHCVFVAVVYYGIS